MNNKSNVLFLIGAIVSVPVLYFVLMWLIKDFQLPPVVLSVVIIYIVLVYPQYQALYALKIVESRQADEYEVPKANKSNWVIFVNDFDMARYFGTDSVWKLIVSWLFKLSIPVFMFSILYVNLLVVFMDLGVTATIVIRYAMLISLFVYLVTKTVILGYFINMFKGFIPALAGILHPIGFMVLTWTVKHYLNSLEEVRTEDTMGLSYE